MNSWSPLESPQIFPVSPLLGGLPYSMPLPLTKLFFALSRVIFAFRSSPSCLSIPFGTMTFFFPKGLFPHSDGMDSNGAVDGRGCSLFSGHRGHFPCSSHPCQTRAVEGRKGTFLTRSRDDPLGPCRSERTGQTPPPPNPCPGVFVFPPRP